jgi:integrase
MSAALRVVTNEEAEQAHLLDVWLKHFSTPESKRTIESALRAIVRSAQSLDRTAPVSVTDFPWHLLADLEWFDFVMDRVACDVGPATARKYRSVMRSLLRYQARTQRVAIDKATRTLDETKGTKPPRRTHPPLPIEVEGLTSILRACKHDPSRVVGSRDMALIVLAAATGARRAELVSLLVENVNLDTNVVHFPKTKGGAERDIGLHKSARPYVVQWLELRGTTNGPLFPSLRKGGRIQQEAMQPHQFWKILKRRAAEADLPTSPAPHDLRRWFVSTLLEAKVDVFTVARAVGHSSPLTTFGYDRRPLEKLREAVDLLFIPDLDSLDPPAA